MNNENWKYGYCECGAKLTPAWFTQYEYDKHGIKTGRKRIACSHLTCPCCFKNYAVDDSFDESWHG